MNSLCLTGLCLAVGATALAFFFILEPLLTAGLAALGRVMGAL